MRQQRGGGVTEAEAGARHHLRGRPGLGGPHCLGSRDTMSAPWTWEKAQVSAIQVSPEGHRGAQRGQMDPGRTRRKMNSQAGAAMWARGSQLCVLLWKP